MITLNTPITVSLGVTANAYKASKFTDNTIDKNVSAFIDYYFIEKESSKLVPLLLLASPVYPPEKQKPLPGFSLP